MLMVVATVTMMSDDKVMVDSDDHYDDDIPNI